MKNVMKRILFAGALVLLATNLFAATAADYSVGDTVIIKKETTKYLTGETPSKWVYFVEHTIQQIGTKRFPEGLLLKGIISWVGPDDVMLKSSQDGKEENNKRADEIDAMNNGDQKELGEYADGTGTKVIEHIDENADNTGDNTGDNAGDNAGDNGQGNVTEGDGNGAGQGEGDGDNEDKEKTKAPNFHRFGIGVRAGAASLMHETDVMGKWHVGGDLLLDLQYGYYWGTKKQNHVGILTGVSVGYSHSGLQSPVDTAYTVSTSDGDIDYSVKASDVDENDGQLQVEIPVMFSFISEKGFFLNVGPKVAIPVWSHYKQGITEPDINAYFPAEGVTVSNEAITGLVQDNQLNTKGKWSPSKVNVMLTAELGYEFQFKNMNSLGLGVYANYSLYDLYKNDTENKSLINVTAPTASAIADVDVLSATDTYAKGMGYFDAGLKLVYNFNFFKK